MSKPVRKRVCNNALHFHYVVFQSEIVDIHSPDCIAIFLLNSKLFDSNGDNQIKGNNSKL